MRASPEKAAGRRCFQAPFSLLLEHRKAGESLDARSRPWQKIPASSAHGGVDFNSHGLALKPLIRQYRCNYLISSLTDCAITMTNRSLWETA